MFLCPWDSPGKNTRVGCHTFLQGIFPIHGSNSPGKPLGTNIFHDSIPIAIPQSHRSLIIKFPLSKFYSLHRNRPLKVHPWLVLNWIFSIALHLDHPTSSRTFRTPCHLYVPLLSGGFPSPVPMAASQGSAPSPLTTQSVAL